MTQDKNDDPFRFWIIPILAVVGTIWGIGPFGWKKRMNDAMRAKQVQPAEVPAGHGGRPVGPPAPTRPVKKPWSLW